MAKSLKSAIQVEWVNVTYHSVVTIALGLAVLAAIGVGGWFYAFRIGPRNTARAAVGRAATRLTEATAIRGNERLQEVLTGAEQSLGQARHALGRDDYDEAMVAAIRSENLSLKVISTAGGDEAKSRMVRFYRFEGDVRVKQAGEFSWKVADTRMVLRMGDQVKTSSSASAQLIYFDGTMTTIHPGSLLEIRDLYEDPVTKVQRVRERLTWGEVQASTQKRNVSGSYHEVATEKVAARSEEAGEFRIAFDRDKRVSVIDVFEGRIVVDGSDRRETLDAGERLRARPDGNFTAKESLPGVPRLLSPSDQRVFLFENPLREQFTLNWEAVPGCPRYRLMISDKSLFTNPLYDSEREGVTAVMDGVAPGSYFWKVAAIAPPGVQGPFSAPRGFRVSSQQIRDRSDDDPPRLEISEFVPIGQMVIINGATEPGATVWVDTAKINVYEDGTFNAVVRLRKEGLNELVLVAQDTAGNETSLKRTAYVELY